MSSSLIALFPLFRARVIGIVGVVLLTSLAVAMPKLVLPTENTAIFQQRPNDFFMYVNRYFEGESSQPWEAGTYGFVRNMKRSAGEVIGTRFHEGADIKPVRRDASGVPLDPVVSIAEGVVAHVNDKSTASNYGKYIVVLHEWGEGPICSLYAHLNKVSVTVGDRVEAGTQLGILGYTGRGIDKPRAHLHFEVALMLSDDFETWHQRHLGSASGHGNFNGRNLSGMNGVDLIARQGKGEVRSIKEYLAAQRGFYSVTITAAQSRLLRERYPWLWRHPQAAYPSTEITFSASGLPLSAAPSKRAVTAPTITRLMEVPGRFEDRTIKRISGSGRKATLTDSGQRYLALIMGE